MPRISKRVIEAMVLDDISAYAGDDIDDKLTDTEGTLADMTEHQRQVYAQAAERILKQLVSRANRLDPEGKRFEL